MQDIFITKIKINEVRNIKDFEINLSKSERKHLIITGKNGSGKTSLLESIRLFFKQILAGGIETLDVEKAKLERFHEFIERYTPNDLEFSNIEQSIKNTANWILNTFGGIELFFNINQNINQSATKIQDQFNKGEFLLKFFEAKRGGKDKFVKTDGVRNLEFKQPYQIDESAGNEFTQHIVNLHYDKLSAKDENDLESANKIDQWFFEFEKTLANLFDEPKLKLVFDRKDRKYQIVENGNTPYTFNQLPDGYSAILDIVTELIMRMEEHKTKSYDVQGIVLIDEIETHLHVDLQKKILPFLTSFFPKIQFIVTTHSPFVLQSISNAVICDLEKQIVTEDLSNYSYDTIVESYFDSDKYSEILKKRVKRYENLLEKKDLSLEETEEFYRLKMELEQAPKFLANELGVKLQQLDLKEKTL